MNPKSMFLKFHPFLFVALFLLMSFLLWRNTRPETESVDKKLSSAPIVTPTSPPTKQYPLINDSCSQQGCLFQEEENGLLLGISTVKGYYQTTEMTAWDVTKTCDTFVVTGGSSTTTDFFVDLVVNKGNGINDVNEKIQPIVTLDLADLSPIDKQKLLSSSEQQPVELIVFFPKRGHGGAPVCYSNIEIIKVN